jgi:hypothetical protein
VNADFPAVIDACVLVNYAVADLLLRLAESPRLYLPRWSEEILNETTRTLIGDLGWSQERAKGMEKEIRDHFPEALVEFPAELLGTLTINEKDRYVLAAAIMGKAEVIVTFNLKHFGPEHLEPWGVQAHHPQVFLQSLWGLDPVGVTSRLAAISHFRARSLEHVLRTLAKTVPKFVSEIAPQLGVSLSDS